MQSKALQKHPPRHKHKRRLGFRRLAKAPRGHGPPLQSYATWPAVHIRPGGGAAPPTSTQLLPPTPFPSPALSTHLRLSCLDHPPGPTSAEPAPHLPLTRTACTAATVVVPQALRTIYDEYNDEEITLTKEELRMIMAIRKGQFPHVEVNPYEPYVDWWVGLTRV